MRINRRVLEQEAQLNAPDPRETNPPCYEDAILLPRPAASFASLKHLGSDDAEADERRKASKRSRSRSEELISRNSDADGASRPKRHILAAKLRLNRPKLTQTVANAPQSMPSTSADPPRSSSTEIITLKHSPRLHRLHSPSTASRLSNKSEFAIEPEQQYMNLAGRSPHPARRMNSSVSIVNQSQTSSPTISTNLQGREPSYCEIDAPEDIVIIENYYRQSKDSLDLVRRKISVTSTETSSSESAADSFEYKNRDSFTSSSSEEYTKFTKDEIQNVRGSQI